MEIVVSECKNGNARAQKQLFDCYAKLMMAVCVRYVRDWHIAEDLMLGGFQKFFSRIAVFEYSDERNLKAYIKKIMINECLMYLRSLKINYTRNELTADVPLDQESILDKLAADELFKLISELPDGYRTVFNLFVVEGLSHKEIASELSISEGTSKSQLNKAKKLLQQFVLKT
ncbi:RNA polymerase sigma factor [Niabella hibiscisoli]|uniref:RNA polymerase sigma factor n=1 Tax=Niabella hibiscisoli TaxID=1825928 RepID=UPI001F0D0170|nr:sigma-70 family RNA polymerase sigma factor [Niabella hibiscisoli]MCH5717344.1 sigma-70 family RNA polymerase sigma factor [Niabella hibiscisoli]